eukprot:3565310-Rhodomonas_salina.1
MAPLFLSPFLPLKMPPPYSLSLLFLPLFGASIWCYRPAHVLSDVRYWASAPTSQLYEQAPVKGARTAAE